MSRTKLDQTEKAHRRGFLENLVAACGAAGALLIGKASAESSESMKPQHRQTKGGFDQASSRGRRIVGTSGVPGVESRRAARQGMSYCEYYAAGPFRNGQFSGLHRRRRRHVE
jgi:hypothetical protein